MRRTCLLLSAGLALLLATTAVALACGPGAMKLPAPVARAVVCGDHCYVVTTDGRLFDVDLTVEKTKELTEVGAKLSPVVDARGNIICVARGQKVLLVDAKTGKITRELDCGQNIRAVGFAGADRLLVHVPKSLDTIDLKTGKVAESRPVSPRVDMLGETTLHMIGGRVFMVGQYSSYGVPITQLSTLDPATGKTQVLKLEGSGKGISGLAAAPDGGFYVTTPAGTFRYDAKNNLVGPVQSLAGGTLVGVWTGQAVTLHKGRMLVVDDPLQVVQSK